MHRPWNTTTALIASLSLAVPMPVGAQDTAEVPEMLCADGSETPCAPGVAQLPSSEMICEDGSDLPCAESVFAVPKQAMICADGAELPCAEGVSASVRPEMVEVLAELHAQAGAVAPETEATAEETAEAPVEEAPASEGEATAGTEPDTGAGDEVASETETEAEATEQADAVETEVAPTTEGTSAETAAEGSGETEATPDESELAAALEAEAQAEAQVEAGAETEPGEEVAAAEVPAETTEETVVPEPDTAATTESDAAAPAEGEATAESEAAPAEAETVPELPVQPDPASGEAPVAAAAAAPEQAEATADVTEEVVTEETTRSSDEDFANKVNEAAAASGPAKDDNGLSDTEKAVLLGLGAVAVGAILSNNRKVELNSGDRVVVSRADGTQQIIKDDNALLRQPGSTVRNETFSDGSTRTTVTRDDGSRIVTIRDAEYRVLRRIHVAADGTETILIDDTIAVEPVDIASLPDPAPQLVFDPNANEDALRAALAREAEFDRRFTLAQVRGIERVRALVPVIDLDAITFETGSAAIRPDQARALSQLGNLIRSYVDEDAREIFLIEGHTDAVGSAAYNLALSDRRAESVALALTEYFDVPPENLVVQGYGEEFLKIPTEDAERANRRASVRRITDLLQSAAN
ncbi:hypothetical protein DEA8626_00918 [Defluviimonas aquaemixtae]|uniref:OmpA-like domain-containing protein n=1 Tax=Albidovulum aquaemixtae TaxID=1542388 RepID=A0A2R8B4F9_9RHOB|nr:OmpA family protein [Defluviimonas aquaemixtae]SPH17400.1 hypothetical protein DEA8626_00918 [Defluviimonas aquaemixtae]